MPRTSFKLTPELDVAELDRSLAFYVNVIGFRVLFDRPEERFAFLDLDGVYLMLEEAAGPGRRFRTAPWNIPTGVVLISRSKLPMRRMSEFAPSKLRC
jgi:catechol 2,3-dioxygenase-like lactoylglutathione lyase family enzyme